MTKDSQVAALLLSVALLLSASLQSVFANNFWFGIIDVAAIVGVVVVREILP